MGTVTVKNIHKQPNLYFSIAVVVFTALIAFAQQHCSVTPEDLIALGGAIAAGIGGYLKGKQG